MDQPTINFRHQIPAVLFPASPPLAALHAHRARVAHPQTTPRDSPSCPRCGSLQVQSSRVKSRVHRRSCRICGATTASPFSIAPFPQSRSRSISQSQPLPSLPPSVDPIEPPKPISPPPLPASAPKSRPKKKSGLQNLLARNRENEHKERQRQKQSQLGGLAAFLTDL